MQLLALMVIGPLVGVEFGVAAFTNPILQRLPDEAYRQARGTGSRILGIVMPFWYIGGAALVVAATLWNPAPALIASTVLMGLVVVLSVAVLVPINNRVAAGHSGDDASFHELVGRWDRMHWLRVALLTASFVALVATR